MNLIRCDRCGAECNPLKSAIVRRYWFCTSSTQNAHQCKWAGDICQACVEKIAGVLNQKEPKQVKHK